MALTCVVEAGDPRVVPLLEEFGAQELWGSLQRSALDNPWTRRAKVLDVRAVHLATRRFGARFIIPGDPEWPEAIAVLDVSDGVQDLGGAPLGLWVRGAGSLEQWSASAVAVVGSRASTPYGERVAADLAAGLAGHGVTVVSGGAFGIDAAAHRGALADGGRTVAVLACGVGVAYPKAHEALLGRISEHGLLVSEYPPEEGPTRRRFLARNRLIASLTRATVIVEAAARSGARNTVSWASACQRPVAAVPGPVGNATSYTPHALIREGEAVLVSNVAEVMELVGSAGEHLVARPPQPRLIDDLRGATLAVYEALPSRGARDAGEVALRSGVAMGAALACLGELSAAGLARQRDDGRWGLGEVQDRPGRLGGVTAPRS